MVEDRRNLLLSKDPLTGRIDFKMYPYGDVMKNDMNHIILDGYPETEKLLEELVIKDLPSKGYHIIPSDKKMNKKKGLGQFKLASGIIDILSYYSPNSLGQNRIPSGIDAILASDPPKDLTGFELSKSKEMGSHHTQILAYRDDLNDMNPDGDNCVIMVAPSYSDRFVKIIKKEEGIKLWTYQVKVVVEKNFTSIKGQKPMHNFITQVTKNKARAYEVNPFYDPSPETIKKILLIMEYDLVRCKRYYADMISNPDDN